MAKEENEKIEEKKKEDESQEQITFDNFDSLTLNYKH